MICNGINFTDTWVLKFETGEQFADQIPCQRYISNGKVDRKTLIAFHALVVAKHKPVDHDNQRIQGTVQEDRTEISDSGNGEGESITDSRPAGDTDVKGGKGRRNKVSKL